MKASEKMAKFVKLEKNGYINIDTIRFIRDEADMYQAILDDEGNGVLITGKDLDSILKASEEQ